MKIIKNWQVTSFPTEHRQGLNLKVDYSNYNQTEYANERVETDCKKINGLYFISHSLIEINGKIIDTQNNKFSPLTTIVDSYWSDFKTINPVKIKFKD